MTWKILSLLAPKEWKIIFISINRLFERSCIVSPFQICSYPSRWAQSSALLPPGNPHSTLATPAFISCATKGGMKSVTTRQMEEIGAEIILSNTYHLFWQPGPPYRHLRWPGKMPHWNYPRLTDSGGFQIFSPGQGDVASEIKGKRNCTFPKMLLKIGEDGARFRFNIDGR
jgi:tRNA-guanine family transglycosylase